MPTVATFEIEYLQYLGPDGRLVREDLPRCGKETESQGALLTELGKRLETFGK